MSTNTQLPTYGFGLPVIAKVLCDIAKRHDAHPYCRINSFAVIDKYDDISKKMLGRNQVDINQSLAWFRPDEKTDPGEDLRLTIMQTSCYRPEAQRNEKCLKLMVAIAQKEKCETCPFEKSAEMVDMENEDVLWSVLDAFCGYYYYKIIRNEGDDVEGVFATPAQIELCDFFHVKDCGVSMQDKLASRRDRLECRTNFHAGYRIKSIEIIVCGCHVSEQKYIDKYDQKDEEFAIVKCDSCF